MPVKKAHHHQFIFIKIMLPTESTFMKRVFPGQYPHLKLNGGVIMAKLIVGVIIGFSICAETGMVAFCVWYEKRFPEAVDRLRRDH